MFLQKYINTIKKYKNLQKKRKRKKKWCQTKLSLAVLWHNWEFRMVISNLLPICHIAGSVVLRGNYDAEVQGGEEETNDHTHLLALRSFCLKDVLKFLYMMHNKIDLNKFSTKLDKARKRR